MVRKAFCVLLLLTPFKHGQVPGVRHLLPEAGGCWTYSATLLLLIASSKQIQNSWSRVFFFFFFFSAFFFNAHASPCIFAEVSCSRNTPPVGI